MKEIYTSIAALALSGAVYAAETPTEPALLQDGILQFEKGAMYMQVLDRDHDGKPDQMLLYRVAAFANGGVITQEHPIFYFEEMKDGKFIPEKGIFDEAEDGINGNEKSLEKMIINELQV